MRLREPQVSCRGSDAAGSRSQPAHRVSSRRRCSRPSSEMIVESVLIEASEVTVHFDRGRFLTRERVHAVNDVSLSIQAGSTLGLAGESGSGKSTLGRALLGLVPVKAGEVRVNGEILVSPDRM